MTPSGGVWRLRLQGSDVDPASTLIAWSLKILGQTDPSPPPATPGVTVTPTSRLVTYEDQTKPPATFTIVLNSQPLANVTINVASSDISEGLVSLSTLGFTSQVTVMFTPSNWSAPQTVYVKGVNDLIVDGNINYTIITDAAVSSDAGYNGLNAANVAATNTDNDRKGKTQAMAFETEKVKDSPSSLDVPDSAVQSIIAYIWRDSIAVGWGWFIDRSLSTDQEVLKSSVRDEQGRLDLLSAVRFDLGFVLGLEDDGKDDDEMFAALSVGTRLSLIHSHDLE
jgi:hypothetical protein